MLVVGAGSIGRRHLANLRNLGVQRLAVCDPAKERLAAITSELKLERFDNFSSALAFQPNAVFVCTPPLYHIEQALSALDSAAHVFIEKPLSHSMQGVGELLRKADEVQRVVQVGYNFRFHPGLKLLKEMLNSGVLGNILLAHAEFGQYLPDWRPWQDYRQSYTARQELGGGILLDASHELEYLAWLLGKPIEVMCMAGKVSGLEVDVEDCADMLVRLASGTQAAIHLDFIQRNYVRSCKLAGELGTAIWDFTCPELKVYYAENKTWQSFPYKFETNDMYIAEVKSFFSSIEAGITERADLRRAADVLAVVLAAKSAHGSLVRCETAY